MAGCYGSGEYPFNIPVTSRFSSESLSTQSSIRSVQQKINSFTRSRPKAFFFYYSLVYGPADIVIWQIKKKIKLKIRIFYSLLS